ncbi:uncharacterized protein [Mytilus edulis]|uniref:uncharacterized protein n=1 Tax=Mytilus edulis TaxID=6550 RepID=UPI0039F0997F
MALILIGVGAAAVGVGGYLSHVPALIFNAIEFKHKDKKVNNLKELTKGDHIIFKREGPGPSHHAIVVDVNEAENKYSIIHFTSIRGCGTSRSKSNATIIEETKLFYPDKVTLRKYAKRKLEGEQIVARAYSLLKKIDKIDYNALTNNCEHVATWCIFGYSRSEQIDKVMAMLGPIGMVPKFVENISRIAKKGDPAK